MKKVPIILALIFCFGCTENKTASLHISTPDTSYIEGDTVIYKTEATPLITGIDTSIINRQ